MSNEDELYAEVERIAAFLGLLVVHAGGEIRIPFETVEAGLPSGSGVRVIPDEEARELVFKIQELPNAK